MKLYILGFLLLSFTAIQLYNSNTAETKLEIESPNSDIQGLSCRNSQVTWRLDDEGLNNQDIKKMAEVMDSGKFQEICVEHGKRQPVIYIHFYLGQNPDITDFSPLLFAINRNFSNTVSDIQMYFDDCDMKDWDSSFKGWTIPEKVYQLWFDFSNNQGTSMKNFIEVLKSRPSNPLPDLFIEISHNNINKEDMETFVETIKNNYKVNESVRLYLGYNLQGDTTEIKENFIDIVKESHDMYWLDLYLEGYQMTEQYLTKLSNAIYNARINHSLFNCHLNIIGSGVSAEKAREIFKKPQDKMGLNFTLQV